MGGPQGVVRVCRKDQVLTVQVQGWGTMRQSLPVRRLAEQCLAGDTKLLRIDLRQCTYLDSTFLGTLLTLQRAACQRGEKKLVLVAPSADCRRLLGQLGIEDVFATEHPQEPDAEEGWTELPCERDDACAFNRNVCQAHQELANVEGKCGQAFAEASRKLNRELGAD
jgi:anti-anti-sigma factor